MAFYLNKLPDGTRLPETGKVDFLLANIPGCRLLPKAPDKLIPDLVAVVSNIGGVDQQATELNELHKGGPLFKKLQQPPGEEN